MKLFIKYIEKFKGYAIMERLDEESTSHVDYYKMLNITKSIINQDIDEYLKKHNGRAESCPTFHVLTYLIFDNKSDAEEFISPFEAYYVMEELSK